MEELNRIELRGWVGSVSIIVVGDTRVAHFSVATNLVYKGGNGEPVIETTWHNVTAWEKNKDIVPLDSIRKGDAIHIIGRVRRQDFVASDGTERYSYEVLASKVETVPE